MIIARILFPTLRIIYRKNGLIIKNILGVTEIYLILIKKTECNRIRTMTRNVQDNQHEAIHSSQH